MVKVLAILLVIGFFLGFVYVNARPYLSGPKIELEAPENYQTFTEPLISVVGTTTRVANLSLNDKPIVITDKGLFSERMLLSPGYNVMELRAEDRFGREVILIRELVLIEEETIIEAQETSTTSTSTQTES